MILLVLFSINRNSLTFNALCDYVNRQDADWCPDYGEQMVLVLGE